MATLSAAKALFDLSEGASDDDYNAYNYMVLTARAKPQARAQIPAVIHVDGTARLQIVREHTDAVTHAYLKALGRRIGVEVAVNTSFNVGGPIAQTPIQALDTLRRAKGMDGVFMFSEEGQVIAAWTRETEPERRRGSLNGSWSGKAKRTPRSGYPERGRIESGIAKTRSASSARREMTEEITARDRPGFSGRPG